jgi:hypothetical protein
MRSYTMQDWIQITGQSSITTVTQSETGWMDMTMFQDVVAWLQVDAASAGTGGTSVLLTYQTAPAKDDILFVPAYPDVALTPGLASNSIMLKNAYAGAVPICRWLRWRLSVTGTPTSSWNATFRILIAANAPACSRAAANSVVVSPANGPPVLLMEPVTLPMHLGGPTGGTGPAPAPGCGCVTPST